MATTSPTGWKFKTDAKNLRRPEPLPQAIYKLRLTGFAPQNTKLKPGETKSTSVNLNPEFTMIAPGQEYDQRVMKYLFNANSQMENWIQDMVHACGLVMEGDIMDDNAHPSMPGIWQGNIEDASTWVYQGPMLNKELEAELYIGVNQNTGEPVNKILRFICRVPNCATLYPKIQHSKGMKSSKSK